MPALPHPCFWQLGTAPAELSAARRLARRHFEPAMLVPAPLPPTRPPVPPFDSLKAFCGLPMSSWRFLSNCSNRPGMGNVLIHSLYYLRFHFCEKNVVLGPKTIATSCFSPPNWQLTHLGSLTPTAFAPPPQRAIWLLALKGPSPVAFPSALGRFGRFGLAILV